MTFPLNFVAMTFLEVKNDSRQRRLEGGAEIHPVNGRKEISACACGGGKVRGQAAAGERVSAFRMRVTAPSSFVWLQSQGLFYERPSQSPAR